MTPRDCDVIGHRAPLPRIETSMIWPVHPRDPIEDYCRDLQRQVEAARIWKTVQEACA